MANKVVTVLEADGVTQTDIVSLDVGRQGLAASKSVALATEDKAVLDAVAASLVTIDGRVDGLETLITSTNTKLDTLNTSVSGATIDTGTPGSPATTEVMTVQGAASMTPLLATVTNTPLTNFGAGEYETVAASQTAQALGATGATGDYISGILVIPATTSPGVVTLLDNATSIPVFVGGASSVSNLVPFFIPLGMISVSGAWKITTGANVSCIGIGNFT
jgi:hypothetical protein